MKNAIYKALYNCTATVEIKPHATLKNLAKEPLLVVFVEGQEIDTAETYSRATEIIYELANDNPYTLLSFDEVSEELVGTMMRKEGECIADFINEQTENKTNYQEDSVWSVNGETCHSDDIQSIITTFFTGLTGIALAAFYGDIQESSINYIGDSLFETA